LEIGFPSPEPGEVHELEDERDEQEGVEIPVEASEKEQNQAEDGGDLGQDEGHEVGPGETLENHRGTFGCPGSEQGRVDETEDDDDGRGGGIESIPQGQPVSDRSEARERPETPSDDFFGEEIDGQGGDHGAPGEDGRPVSAAKDFPEGGILRLSHRRFSFNSIFRTVRRPRSPTILS
jgi:hypothetical protein